MRLSPWSASTTVVCFVVLVTAVSTGEEVPASVFGDDYDIYDPTSLDVAAQDKLSPAGTPGYMARYVPQLRATEGAYAPISAFKVKSERSTLFPGLRVTPSHQLSREELSSVKESAQTHLGHPTPIPTLTPKRSIRSGLHVMASSYFAESHFLAPEDQRFLRWSQAEEVRLTEGRKKLTAEYVRLRKEAAASYQEALEEEDGNADSKGNEKVLPLVQTPEETIKRAKRRHAVMRGNTSSLKDRMTAVALDIRGVMKRLRGAFFPHPYISGVRSETATPPSPNRQRTSKTEKGLAGLRDVLLRFHVDDHMKLFYQLNTTAPATANSKGHDSEEEQYEKLLYGSDSYGLSGIVPGTSSQPDPSRTVPALTQRDYDLALFSLLRPSSFFDTVAATDAAGEQQPDTPNFVLGNGNIKASESPLHTQAFHAGQHSVLAANPNSATFIPDASPNGIFKDIVSSIVHVGRRVLSAVQVALRAVRPQSGKVPSSLGELENGVDFPTLLSVPFFDVSDAEKLHDEYVSLAKDVAALEVELQNTERGSYRLDVLARATRNVNQGVSGDGGDKTNQKGKRNKRSKVAEMPQDGADLETRIEDEVVVLSQTAPQYYRNLRSHYMTPQLTDELNRLYTALYFNQRVQWSLVHSSYPLLKNDILPSIQAAAAELAGRMQLNDESTRAKRRLMKEHTGVSKRMKDEIARLEGLLRQSKRMITQYQARTNAAAKKPIGLEMGQLVDLIRWVGIARRHRDALGGALRLPEFTEDELARMDSEKSNKGATRGNKGKSGMDFERLTLPWEMRKTDMGESVYETTISARTADAATFRVFGLSQYEALVIFGSILIPCVVDAALIQSPVRMAALFLWCVRSLLPWLSGAKKRKATSKLVARKHDQDEAVVVAGEKRGFVFRAASLLVVLLGVGTRIYIAVGYLLLPLLFPVLLGVDQFERWVLQSATQLRGLVTGSTVPVGVAGSGSSPHIHFTTQVLITRPQYVWLYGVASVLVLGVAFFVMRPVFRGAGAMLSTKVAKRK